MRNRPISSAFVFTFAVLLTLHYSFPKLVAAEGDPEVILRPTPRRTGNAGESTLAPAGPHGRHGLLDKSFGTGGLVMESGQPGQITHASDVITQPDGRILLAGADTSGARIFRYEPDGSPDPTFGDNGSVTFGPEGLGVEGSVVAMALRPDGKIVVAGERTGPIPWDPSDWYRYVARLNPDGSLDTGFGTLGGFTVVGNSGGNERLDDLALQSDGKIVVGGRRAVSGWEFYLARLNEDGSADTGFGVSGGELTTSFPGKVRAWVVSILIQPDGRIVAVGDATNDVGIARYEPDGKLDTSFGTGGLLASDILVGPKWGGLQPDGSIVVAGSWRDIPFPYPDMAVTRFSATGTLDTAFGDAGRARIDFDKNYDAAEAGAIQADGGIVVGGTAYVFNAGSARIAFGVARLDRDGRLDKRFGRGGRIAIRLGEPELEAIALQPDGRVLTAGTNFVFNNSSSYFFTWFLARFRP